MLGRVGGESKVKTKINRTYSLSLRNSLNGEKDICKELLYHIINAKIEIYAKCFSNIGKKKA